METSDITEETCIIVVETGQGSKSFSTGIVVDHVEEVLDIAGKDIEEAPQFGSTVNTDFILGMGKIGDSVKILLDIDRVLAGDDFSSFGGGSMESFEQQEIPLADDEAGVEEASADVEETATSKKNKDKSK
jgi:hypothetical protein